MKLARRHHEIDVAPAADHVAPAARPTGTGERAGRTGDSAACTIGGVDLDAVGRHYWATRRLSWPMRRLMLRVDLEGAAMVPDAGVSVTLTHLVGLRKAMEILMLNPVITAREALEMGLINRVVDDEKLMDEAFALARQLAAGAPAALAGTKRLLWNGLGSSVDACMPEENRMQAQLSGMADAREGLAAVIEKRTPTFMGR